MKTCCLLVALAFPSVVAGAPLGMLASNELTIAQHHVAIKMTAFRDTVGDANYAFFGFHSPTDILQVTNAEPMLIHFIPLDRLRNYHPGDDVSGLLQTSSRVIFPLLVGTNVRSSIAFRVDATKNSVTDVRFGQRKLIRDLVPLSRSIPLGEVRSGEKPFVVEIPVFDIWLLGYVDPQGKIVLLATSDLPLGVASIGRGDRVTEAAMFQLAIMAQRYNGLPN